MTDPKPHPKLSILAIMAVHNAAPTLARVLEHLQKNSIDLILIDDGSSDDTLAIAKQYIGAPLREIVSLPHDGVYRWKPLLQLKERIAEKSGADWVIHHDSDEIFESPRQGETLREFVQRQDSLGMDVIDCDEFVFLPRDEQREYGRRDFPEDMQDYYYFNPKGRTRHQFVRRSSAPLTWSTTGGHKMDGTSLRIADERVRLRHYIGLSMDHLRAQYLGRVFAADELQAGWHRKRVAPNPDFLIAPDPARLWTLERDGWRMGRPEQEHLFFDRDKPYAVPHLLPPQPEGIATMPFVVGVGRSGTTLLRLMLDAHPDLAMTPETQWLSPALAAMAGDPTDVARLRTLLEATPGWQDMGLTADALDAILAQHDPTRPSAVIRALYHAYAARFGKTRVGDKTPTHAAFLHQIAQALPEARFIHIIRDGRDVAVSYRDLWFGPGRDVKKAARMWIWQIREARQQAQFLPSGTYMELRYETLVQNPEPSLRRIADFLGLPFHPDQLASHIGANIRMMELQNVQRGTRIITGAERRMIHELTSSPPNPARIGRYKSVMSQAEIRSYEAIAGGMLGDLGYLCEAQ